MLSPICVSCKIFYVCQKNGFPFLFRESVLWEGDLWVCPKCDHEIIVGVALEPIITHTNSNFREVCKTEKVTLNIEG